MTEMSTKNMGRIPPAGTYTEFSLPTAGTQHVWIATGPDGNLWFTEDNVNQIGRITPSGAITEFPVSGGRPFGITTGPDGNLWFTEDVADKVARIDRKSTRLNSSHT